MALSIVPPDRTQYQVGEVPLCSTDQVQFETTYIAPASIVPVDHQQYATCKGLTYVRPLQRMDDEMVLLREAQLDHRLGVHIKFCALILTEVQSAQTFPYDRALRSTLEETNTGKSSGVRFGLVYRLRLRREPALQQCWRVSTNLLQPFQSSGLRNETNVTLRTKGGNHHYVTTTVEGSI